MTTTDSVAQLPDEIQPTLCFCGERAIAYGLCHTHWLATLPDADLPDYEDMMPRLYTRSTRLWDELEDERQYQYERKHQGHY